MDALATLKPYLNSLDELTHTAVTGGKNYVEPALRNLGTICIPVLREVVSPASFRNADPEVTDIAVDGVRRVRAVANKFKYGERRRGLQVLRFFKAGGTMAQNRTEFEAKDPASKGYDLNTFVFGDSANRGKYVLPVKAGVQYSDAISLAPYSSCVDQTFHNRASEDGSLWDAAAKGNSVNLFERHFLLPGTLLLQVLTLTGRTAPLEALSHLLLCVGLAGAYGGQTSVYGINVRNHVVGLYAARMERALASPYVAASLLDEAARASPAAAIAALDGLYREAHPVRIGPDETGAAMRVLVDGVEAGDEAMGAAYRASHTRVGAFFDAWFGKP